MISRKYIFALAVTLIAAGIVSANAGDHKMVVAVKTGDFERVETDISHLGVGDAETIHTESGKTIDLLRTQDGIEIYVDGELMDTGMGGDQGLHEDHHVIHKNVEIICESEDDCDEMVFMSEDEDIDVEVLHEELLYEEGEHERVIIIKKRVKTD